MTRGGARTGAGRPKGQGRYGESTKAIRVPESLLSAIQEFVEHKGFKLPLFTSTVAAGFPTAAEGEVEAKLDLNELLVKHPADSFFLKVSGDSMINAGIHHNDILLIDRNIKPSNGKIVIAAVDGQLTVKRLEKTRDKLYLLPENVEFPPIEIKPENDIHIWGVVTHVIHAL